MDQIQKIYTFTRFVPDSASGGDWFVVQLTDGRRYRLSGIERIALEKSGLRRLHGLNMEFDSNLIDRTTPISDRCSPFIGKGRYIDDEDICVIDVDNGEELRLSPSDGMALIESKWN